MKLQRHKYRILLALGLAVVVSGCVSTPGQSPYHSGVGAPYPRAYSGRPYGEVGYSRYGGMYGRAGYSVHSPYGQIGVGYGRYGRSGAPYGYGSYGIGGYWPTYPPYRGSYRGHTRRSDNARNANSRGGQGYNQGHNSRPTLPVPQPPRANLPRPPAVPSPVPPLSGARGNTTLPVRPAPERQLQMRRAQHNVQHGVREREL